MKFNIIGDEKDTALSALMRDCAQAAYDDAKMTALGQRINAREAMPALQAVAEILGIDGPREILTGLEQA